MYVRLLVLKAQLSLPLFAIGISLAQIQFTLLIGWEKLEHTLNWYFSTTD